MRGVDEALDHAWWGKGSEPRRGDQRVVRHRRQWLQAGVREAGHWRQQAAGTPHGGRARPRLAHLSRPDGVDLWAAPWRRRHARGDGLSVRDGDDGLVGVPHQAAAAQCRSDLRARCHRCALARHPEKTRRSACGRWASARRQRRGPGTPATCDVLGWTPRWSPTQRGTCTVRRGPIAPRRRQQRQEVQQTRRERRHWPIATRGAWLTRVVVGHSRSSGVPRNLGRRRVVRAGIRRSWCRIVRRRRQRHRLPWQRRSQRATQWLPEPHIMHPYPAQRLRVTTRGRSPGRSCRTPGSGRGVPGHWHPYRDPYGRKAPRQGGIAATPAACHPSRTCMRHVDQANIFL
jgi:RNA-directed DNA polymerase